MRGEGRDAAGLCGAGGREVAAAIALAAAVATDALLLPSTISSMGTRWLGKVWAERAVVEVVRCRGRGELRRASGFEGVAVAGSGLSAATTLFFISGQAKLIGQWEGACQGRGGLHTRF